MKEKLRALNRSFYFIRHGESQANADKVCAGRFDSPLTEKGRGQAEYLAGKDIIFDPAPDYMVTSGLQRAKDTGAILNTNFDLSVERHTGLAEQYYGDWQSMCKPSLISEHGKHWMREPLNGESYDEFGERIVKALHDILSCDERLPLLVGHGGMVKVLLYYYEVESLAVIDNCTFYYFKHNGAQDGLPWDLFRYDPEARQLVECAIKTQRAA